MVFQFSFDDDACLNDGDASNGPNGAIDDYEFATHVIKVRRSGEVTEVQSLWELEGINDSRANFAKKILQLVKIGIFASKVRSNIE